MSPTSFLFISVLFCGLMAFGNLRELYNAEPLYSDKDYLEQVENLVYAIGAWVAGGCCIAAGGLIGGWV